MDDTMIERVARAIRAETTGFPDDGSPIAGAGADYVGIYTDVARAAFAAMREPTNEMQEAGFGASHWEDQSPLQCWQAMIDAALGQQTQKGE